MSASVEPVVLLEEELAWIAGLPRGKDSSAPWAHHQCVAWKHLRMMCGAYEDPVLEGGTFSVPHYGPGQWGDAYGPLSLGQTLRFCQLVTKELAAHGKVAVCTEPGDEQERANIAVMVGAYLIIDKKWTSEQVLAKMGRRRAQRGGVGSCWAAFGAASRMGWVCSGTQCGLTLSKMALQYDIAWVVPGLVAVGADPVTVVNDPRPFTMKALSSEQVANYAAAEAGTQSTLDSASLQEQAPSAKNSPVKGDDKTVKTAHTVCKDYETRSCSSLEDLLETEECSDFTTWCSNNNISLVVRVNLHREPGLTQFGGSYDPRTLEQSGIAHAQCGYPDVNGAVPPPAIVKRMLHACGQRQEGSAVLVHCKGGFGRSMALACCFIIHEFDLPGDILLAWARIARPGSIVTQQQETFLSSLKGRTSMEKLVSEQMACCTIA
eukprot:CAMPEP_0178467540 /NCGR_PEP_ID=MMETSP0689_2-20121128/52463_1 /TAXON_ID=160604 /ORGANISM="Amphidinium massartii, Strain CS-259" /LENGTH=433 /DNA_ID=CAMNT_0020094581 /DNA_START=33 /DNA_END=1335 /DNA_ORIENTATION=-